MSKRIFPILGFLRTDLSHKDLIRLGTGFFINGKGHFFSVAHNFVKYKKPMSEEELNVDCLAFIDGELHEIKIIHNEYNRYESDENDPDYKDFVIGKIDVDSSEEYIARNSDKNVIVGYSKNILPHEQINQLDFNGNQFRLYEIPISITDNALRHNGIFITSFPNVLFFNVSDNLHGLSGGPVIYNKEILGVLSSKCFVKSDYLFQIAQTKISNELK